jgi:hypothetical protein
MPDERERRIALNEAAFRVANERREDWPERQEAEEPLSYYCECANPDCRLMLEADRDVYERVRSDSRHFLIAPGHQVPDAETVIEETVDYAVIEKAPGVDPIVKGTDPRREE